MDFDMGEDVVALRTGLRQLVKEEMVGTSTCTHLNDLLSSLFQVDVLI